MSHEETKLSSVTLEEMKSLSSEIAELRDKEKEAAAIKAKITEDLEGKERRVLQILMENELTQFKSDTGTISLSFRFSAALPVGLARDEFYEYLKGIGRFEEMVSVHSIKFNSWVKEQYELAAEKGQGEPEIPGVTDVKTVPRLSFRRTR